MDSFSTSSRSSTSSAAETEMHKGQAPPVWSQSGKLDVVSINIKSVPARAKAPCRRTTSHLDQGRHMPAQELA